MVTITWLLMWVKNTRRNETIALSSLYLKGPEAQKDKYSLTHCSETLTGSHARNVSACRDPLPWEEQTQSSVAFDPELDRTFSRLGLGRFACLEIPDAKSTGTDGGKAWRCLLRGDAAMTEAKLIPRTVCCARHHVNSVLTLVGFRENIYHWILINTVQNYIMQTPWSSDNLRLSLPKTKKQNSESLR